MVSTRSSTPARAATTILALFASFTNAYTHDHSLLSHPSAILRTRQALAAMTYEGCYSSSTGLTDQGSYMYQTKGYCQPICVKQDQAVLGLSGGSNCWCGDTLPPASSKVDDSSCNTPCNGYGQENCGGTGFYSVYLTGTEGDVANADGSSSSSSESESSTSSAAASPTTSTAAPPSSSVASTTAPPSVVTSVAPGQTIVVTQPAAQSSGGSTATPTPESKPHSTNVAGIAAGVVIGVVAVAAIIGGLIFWLKRRKQKAAEDEYKRSTQVNAFMRGTNEPKPPPTAYSQMSDSRLDPMVGRRNSAGSIADAEDYSRKILRVANPDGT
ncbi:Protein SLG1 [Elasticomyces elasticus]|nr:Protein SLG1 [Elasticomyces elasticus]KAK3662395.1 Protein SLG1 [Elasticomyces elasticus]KAK4926384.1 Protein SLG1 [Elasticomyces elasticus]KAK5761243.1 Protein SLG1 [Elasticomyces elasticus]